jgi:hypothetical protein
MDRVYKDTVLTKTFVATDLLTDTAIGTWQEDYPLREVEFERIKNGKPVTFIWANSIFLTTLGFGLNLLAKGYSHFTDGTPPIHKGEWIALSSGLAVSVILYIIGLCLPNNRKKVMKTIEQHFKSAPTTRQAYRGPK